MSSSIPAPFGVGGESVPGSHGGVVDPAPRPVHRSFTAGYRARIVAEYEAAPRGEKGAVLRREGLYQSQIREWTTARDIAEGTGGVTVLLTLDKDSWQTWPGNRGKP